VHLQGNTITKGPPWGRGVGPEKEPPGRPQHYLSADTLPFAISWVRGGRPIILGKIFWRDGRVCLGTPYKWRLLPGVVSLPAPVVDILIAVGVEVWIVRDDLRRRAWCIPLSRLAKAPVRNGERCVGLKDMEPAPWVRWPYAERTVDLLELTRAVVRGRQLALEGVR